MPDHSMTDRHYIRTVRETEYGTVSECKAYEPGECPVCGEGTAK